MPNLELINTVSTVVKNNGDSILEKKQFWNILQDYYKFNHEPSLKKVYSEIIDDECPKKLLALKGKNKETQKFINKYFANKEASLPSIDKDEYASALFSIAIALKTLNEDDYKQYIKDLSSNPRQNNNANPSKNNPNKKHRKESYDFKKLLGFGKGIFNSIWLYLLPSLIFFIGLNIFLFLSSLYVDTLKSTTSFWTLLIFYVIIIYIFCQIIFYSISKQRNQKRRNILITISIPLIAGIFIESLIPLISFDQEIRFSMKYQLNGIYDNQPEILTLILYMIAILSIIYNVFENYSRIFNRLHLAYKINRKALTRDSIVILVFIASFYFILWSPQNDYFSQIIEDATNSDSVNVPDEPGKILESSELSFQDISLNSPYKTAESNLSKKDKDSKWFDSKSEFSYSIFVKDINNDFVENLHNAEFVSENLKENHNFDRVSGKTASTEINLYDTKPIMRIFEYNDSVGAISVSFSSRGDINKILKLYVEKYGLPQIVENKDSKFKNNPMRLKWKFDNGIIGVSRMDIVYISNSFADLLDSSSSRYKAYVNDLNQAAHEYEIILTDSIRKAEASKRQKDSILHNNTIKDI